uniref:Uncharacterized protein n=1 Tax=Caenorhabditis japonica TaxID=281687 RepID=A0A8R1I9N3_CAEJA
METQRQERWSKNRFQKMVLAIGVTKVHSVEVGVRNEFFNQRACKPRDADEKQRCHATQPQRVEKTAAS